MSADAPKGVIFDCDGTLVDSEPLSARAWKAALLPYGYEVTDEDLRQCIGRSYTHTHAFFAARAPIPDRAALWVRLCAEMFPLIDAELEPFADAVATVEVRAGMATVAVVRDGSDRAALGQAHVVVETLSPQALGEAGRVGDRC